MKTITFQVTNEQANYWAAMLGDHFERHRDSGLNVLARVAMFKFVKDLAAAEAEKAVAAMNKTEGSDES